MIKYAEIPGYKALGECMLFSHLYQWMSEKEDEFGYRRTILINTNDFNPRVFKGYVLTATQEFKSFPIEGDELAQCEEHIGAKLEQVTDFLEFIKGTVAEPQFGSYKPVKEATDAETI